MTSLFRGVTTALVTPMNQDMTVDYDSYRRFVRFQLDSGINGLVVSGTTGEGSTLTMDEKLELLKIALEERKNLDVPVILGTGSNNTTQTIINTRIAKENGADAALIVTPYYNKTSQKGLIAHYFAIADAVNIPIILYNVPGRTGMTISPETVAELSKHKNIIALKDATGDMNYLESIKAIVDENANFSLYSGDDGTFFDFLVHGGDGVISVISNTSPKSFIGVYKAFTNGDIQSARKIQNRLNPYIKSLFSDVSPTPVKVVLNDMGYCKDIFRLPLIPTNDTVRKNVLEHYRKVLDLEV